MCTLKLRLSFSQYNVNLTKLTKKGSKHLKTINFRIVSVICQHNFDQAQRGLVSFQRKRGHYFEKNEKIQSYI